MFPAEFSEETSDLPCGIQICGYETAERAEPFLFPEGLHAHTKTNLA